MKTWEASLTYAVAVAEKPFGKNWVFRFSRSCPRKIAQQDAYKVEKPTKAKHVTALDSK